MPAQLRYKLPSGAEAFDPEFWNLGTAEQMSAPARISPIAVFQYQEVYCLGVAETENFIAGGMILHNCAPVNLYGATKFVAECYAVQSNSYSLPRSMAVACARYGNVLGSRGSVVHIWREQLRQGQPLMITDPGMTRFIITLRQAADFVLRALADMEGGEVFVPRLPAARIETLAQAVTDDYWHGPTAMTTTVTGLRPGGEKLHETLLTSEEPGRTWWEGGSFKRMIVLPGHHSWRETFLPPPKHVPVEQPYTSDAADRMLSVSELVDMLRDVP